MTAVFYDERRKLIKTIHFGAERYTDYTMPPLTIERKENSK